MHLMETEVCALCGDYWMNGHCSKMPFHEDKYKTQCTSQTLGGRVSPFKIIPISGQSLLQLVSHKNMFKKPSLISLNPWTYFATDVVFRCISCRVSWNLARCVDTLVRWQGTLLLSCKLWHLRCCHRQDIAWALSVQWN